MPSPTRLQPCPHCGRDTDATVQRCAHCGLTMLSDRSYAHLTRTVLPLVEQIESQLDQNSAQALPRLRQLDEATDAWPELRAWYERKAAEIPPELHAQAALRRRVLRLNWTILAFFVVVAVIGGFYTGDWLLAVMLSLPVAGWYWLGIHRLRQS